MGIWKQNYGQKIINQILGRYYGRKGLGITLATIQSFLVILLAYLLSFVKEAEV